MVEVGMLEARLDVCPAQRPLESLLSEDSGGVNWGDVVTVGDAETLNCRGVIPPTD
jgi:hypothetical protein